MEFYYLKEKDLPDYDRQICKKITIKCDNKKNDYVYPHHTNHIEYENWNYNQRRMFDSLTYY
jgi:hypothetical protein